ncbi:hypothetical protein ACOSQ2_019848 [Xanthoceras sorbifolium]
MKIGEVKQLGAFTDRGRFDMKIGTKTILDGIHLGDNIAVNGTCLTTLKKTSLTELKHESLVIWSRPCNPQAGWAGILCRDMWTGRG